MENCDYKNKVVKKQNGYLLDAEFRKAAEDLIKKAAQELLAEEDMYIYRSFRDHFSISFPASDALRWKFSVRRLLAIATYCFKEHINVDGMFYYLLPRKSSYCNVNYVDSVELKCKLQAEVSRVCSALGVIPVACCFSISQFEYLKANNLGFPDDSTKIPNSNEIRHSTSILDCSGVLLRTLWKEWGGVGSRECYSEFFPVDNLAYASGKRIIRDSNGYGLSVVDLRGAGNVSLDSPWCRVSHSLQMLKKCAYRQGFVKWLISVK